MVAELVSACHIWLWM